MNEQGMAGGVSRRNFIKGVIAAGATVSASAYLFRTTISGQNESSLPGAVERLRLLVLGRYSEAKGLPYVLRGLRAALDAGVDVELLVHGPALTEAERAHRTELAGLVDELELGDRVRLEGPVPRSTVPSLFASADALVNNMRAGAPDKVVYEAAAACVPVLVSNPVFDELVAGLEPPLLFRRERPDELAAAIASLADADLAAVGRALRERVEARHSVETWAAGVLAAAGL